MKNIFWPVFFYIRVFRTLSTFLSLNFSQEHYLLYWNVNISIKLKILYIHNILIQIHQKKFSKYQTLSMIDFTHLQYDRALEKIIICFEQLFLKIKKMSWSIILLNVAYTRWIDNTNNNFESIILDITWRTTDIVSQTSSLACYRERKEV